MKTLSLLVSFLAVHSLFADVPPAPSRFEQNSGKATIQTPKDDAPKHEARPEADFLKDLKEGVQITELGCMRALFVFDTSSGSLKKQVTQAFSDADFRVFTTSETVEGEIQPNAFLKIGSERYADLVVFTSSTSKEKPKLGALRLFETEVTIQVFNPMSEEMLVAHTARAIGKRHIDPEVAARTANENAVAATTKEVIAKTLEKAHKILVHEAQLKGVQDHKHLLEILNYTAKLKGVYHVRQISYDKTSKLAIIEIIAAPQTEVFWRAYLEDLPKRTEWHIDVQRSKIILNQQLRAKNPGWTTQA